MRVFIYGRPFASLQNDKIKKAERKIKMNFAAVFHTSGSPCCYPLNENEMAVNLKTGKDVERVWICYGDPYLKGIAGSKEKWEGIRREITEKKDLAHHIWWSAVLRPDYKRLKYYFILEAAGETWYYLENGFMTREQMDLEERMLQYFIFPWMNPADICRTPAWVRDTVWYQIFPDRFCNGNKENDPCGVQKWRKGPVTNDEFFGGDLEGIIQRLDYLENLGITGIYMTPIFKAPSVHKYDTEDYMETDPHFGEKETFRRLVQEAHNRGIRIMIDCVFNHCGLSFAPWQDVLKRGPESPYYNWFMINRWPFNLQDYNTRDGKYYSFAFYGQMPKMNTNQEEVIQYFGDVCEYWVKEFDVDGIRFDVANEVSHRFCRILHRRLKGLKPDLYLLGEIWHDSGEWLRGDEYDGVMNYPLTSGIQDFWVDRSLTARDFEWMINRSYTMYMRQNNFALFNLLDSHDTDRLMTRNHGDEDAFFQQLAVLFTMPGSPCIFYGTEIGLEGGHDPDCRRCMPWDEIDSGIWKERAENLRTLIRLRQEHFSFRSMEVFFGNKRQESRMVEYSKTGKDGEVIQVYLNCTGNEAEIAPGEILFARNYKEGRLAPGGTVIAKEMR